MTRDVFHKKLRELHQEMLRMGTMVEEAIYKSVEALAKVDAALARQVIEADTAIDKLEIELERRCLTLLATQQPLAKDLRVIGTILKTITDLERIADHAVDIGHVTIELEGKRLIKPLIDIPRMAGIAKNMLHDVLTAFVEEDVELAIEVGNRDDEIDNLYDQIFNELLIMMMSNPTVISQATQLLLVGLYLERIGDHTTNIAEWVHYMVTGSKPSKKW